MDGEARRPGSAHCALVPVSLTRLSLGRRPLKAPPTRSLTLLESGRTFSAARLLHTALGMALHGTVVAGSAVVLARQPAIDPDARPDRAPLFLAPEPKPLSRTLEERLQYVGLAAGPVPVEATDPAPDGDAGNSITVPGMAENVVPVDEVAEEGYEEFVLSEIDVDSAVTPDPESGGPEYPVTLLDQQVEGVVLARFVVDSTGRVTPGSFSALEASHELFTQAVRDALPRMKFRPAYVGTRRVSQLVVQSFAFRITKAAVDTTAVDTMVARPSVARR